MEANIPVILTVQDQPVVEDQSLLHRVGKPPDLGQRLVCRRVEIGDGLIKTAFDRAVGKVLSYKYSAIVPYGVDADIEKLGMVVLKGMEDIPIPV